MIDRGLLANGVAPDYIFRTNDNSAMQAMVRAGMGYAIMPLLAVDVNDQSISARELDPPFEPRRVALAVAKGRTHSPALDRFIELAEQVTAPRREHVAP
jgi:DNA-binding transcriptional LysR family regulator